MAFPVASRKAAFVSAPRAFLANGPPGQVAALTVSTTAGAVSLLSGISQAAVNRTTGDDPKQAARNYVTIECDVDLGIILSSTLAGVTGGNVPVIAAVGSLVSNVYTGAAGTCFLLYAKQPIRILLQDTTDLFMGFVASGAGTMRFYQSSSDNA